MRALNGREKNLMLLVFSIVSLYSMSLLKKRWKDQVQNTAVELSQMQEKVTVAQALLTTPDRSPAQAAAPKPPSDGSRTSLQFLREITTTKEMESLRVISADRADNGYKLILEGRFSETMRFLSYLERMESKFLVRGLDLTRVQAEQAGPNQAAPATKDIRSVFSLIVKAGAG